MNEKPHYPGNSIMIRPNGPLICTSDSQVIIQDDTGTILKHAKELALCRCGGSKNKPLCDGSHKDLGFAGHQEFNDAKSEQLDSCDGDLVITVKPNAMLSIQSPVTIFSRSGNSVTTRSRGALCRCGQSKNKPFCDISHKNSGFVSTC